MEKSVTEFIWQMIILVLFIGALSLFFFVNNSMRDTMAVVDTHISKDRNITEGSYEETSASSSDMVLGSRIIFQISKGLEMPMIVDGVYIDIDAVVDVTVVEEAALYRKSYSIDSDGKLYAIRYIKVL